MHACIIEKKTSQNTVVCQLYYRNSFPTQAIFSCHCLFDVNSSDCLVGAEQMKLQCLECKQLGLPIRQTSIYLDCVYVFKRTWHQYSPSSSTIIVSLYIL